MGVLSRARPRGKRYETTLRVGTLANLALVSARGLRAAPAMPPPRPAPAWNEQGGQRTWTSSSWR
jgi:hypothetical protein